MVWASAGHIIAGLLAVLGSSPAGNMPQPEATEQVAEELSQADILAIQRERYSRYTVPVHIQGQGPFQFMIDTGAQATVLSTTLADQLQLFDRNSATLVGMASRKAVQTVPVRDLTLGSRNFHIETAPLVQRANIGGADGILGLDSLRDQRVLIDFENQHIAVDDAEELGGNSGFDIVVRARRQFGQLIITRAKLNGVRCAVIVDTGAQGSIGNPELLRRLRHGKEAGSTEMTDVNGRQITGNVRMARSLEFDRAELTNFPIAFADSPTFEALDLHEQPALILGMAELRLFRRVAIDFSSRRVLFEFPDHAKVPSDLTFGGWSTRIKDR